MIEGVKEKSGEKGRVIKRRRKRGTGALMARNGRWVIRWHEGSVTHQETTQFSTATKAGRQAAEELLEKRSRLNILKDRRDQLAVIIAEKEDIEARIRRIEQMATPVGEKMKLGGLVEAWKKSPRRKDCSPVMLARYAAQLAAFVDWAGKNREVAAVDDALAEKYAMELAERSSGSTWNKHINALDAAWRAVGRAAGAAGNPWAELPRKRLETHVRRILTRDEVAAIVREAEGEWKRLILIGLHTGLRLGDAAQLRWDDFRPDGVLALTTRKTGAFVQLPGEALLAALGKRGRGFITPKIAELYQRDDSAVSKQVRRIFERAGIKTRAKKDGWSVARPEASYHSLRHTFVTRAIEAGIPAAIVRALVGHSAVTMTEHYTHVGGEAILEAFRRAGL